jgi:hypothetical protein
MALGRKTGGRQKGSLNLSTREMRIKAGKEILDRGYGKARQSSVHAVGTYDFSALSDEQLRVGYEILKLASPKSLGHPD